MRKPLRVAVLILAAFSMGSTASAGSAPVVAHAASTCADYSTQAEAQRAADTRDADGDGIYCESLPCPCSTGRQGSDHPPPEGESKTRCIRPKAVQEIAFSRTRYRHIRRHYLSAVRKGWPRILIVNRPGAPARRERLLQDVATRAGYDRDEYPPAVGRGRGPGLTRGSHPKGWLADVAYVGSHENRSHGTRLGIKLRRFCNTTRFRYVFY